MAKIIITANTNTFKVELGEYGGTSEQVVDENQPALHETIDGSWHKSKISFHGKHDHVLVLIDGEMPFRIGPTEDLSNGILKVDQVGDNVNPSLAELKDYLYSNH